MLAVGSYRPTISGHGEAALRSCRASRHSMRNRRGRAIRRGSLLASTRNLAGMTLSSGPINRPMVADSNAALRIAAIPADPQKLCADFERQHATSEKIRGKDEFRGKRWAARRCDELRLRTVRACARYALTRMATTTHGMTTAMRVRSCFSRDVAWVRVL